MALFGKNKTEDKKVVATKSAIAKAESKTTRKAVAVSSTVKSVSASAGSILRPRITEKSGLLSQTGTYTFEVSSNANKSTVAAAIKELYKVTPTNVAIINLPAKNVFVRGRKGVVSGIRKALVTLKKGDKIDFV